MASPQIPTIVLGPPIPDELRHFVFHWNMEVPPRTHLELSGIMEFVATLPPESVVGQWCRGVPPISSPYPGYPEPLARCYKSWHDYRFERGEHLTVELRFCRADGAMSPRVATAHLDEDGMESLVEFKTGIKWTLPLGSLEWIRKDPEYQKTGPKPSVLPLPVAPTPPPAPAPPSFASLPITGPNQPNPAVPAPISTLPPPRRSSPPRRGYHDYDAAPDKSPNRDDFY